MTVLELIMTCVWIVTFFAWLHEHTKRKDMQKIEKLKQDLDQALKDERYEDASTINRQINRLQNERP